MIKPEKEKEVYIIDFKLHGIGKSYHLGEDNVKLWRINEECSKVKRSKLGKASKALSRIP